MRYGYQQAFIMWGCADVLIYQLNCFGILCLPEFGFFGLKESLNNEDEKIFKTDPSYLGFYYIDKEIKDNFELEDVYEIN
jgi:hypothetical protein